MRCGLMGVEASVSAVMNSKHLRYSRKPLAYSRQVVTGSLHGSADYRRGFGRKILAVKYCSREVREKAPVSWW
ncbi:hypothetical protein NQZ68_017385 [Dissostichus eleginoides]|nr:hypothetical protein NQZ68_017385 [Dissostichus eleginoides]